jgi:hypothetical protein
LQYHNEIFERLVEFLNRILERAYREWTDRPGMAGIYQGGFTRLAIPHKAGTVYHTNSNLLLFTAHPREIIMLSFLFKATQFMLSKNNRFALFPGQTRLFPSSILAHFEAG